MSLWSRMANIFRGERLNREIDEELQAHIEEAIATGRDPLEARRAFGSALRYREGSRDVRLIGWLESLRADAVFGWRQLAKTKMTSAAAIFSLALAIGACTSAFRLIDAVLQRRREIGIRIAIGARAGSVARLVTLDVFSMVLVGAAAGVGLGMISVRSIESLFYQVKATDLQMLALPALAILAGALLAALRPVIQAVRIDPASMLRAE